MADRHDRVYYGDGCQEDQSGDDKGVNFTMSSGQLPMQDQGPSRQILRPSVQEQQQPVYSAPYNPPSLYPSQLLQGQQHSHSLPALQHPSAGIPHASDFTVPGATYRSLLYPSEIVSFNRVLPAQQQQQEALFQPEGMPGHDELYVREEYGIPVAAPSQSSSSDPEAGKYEVSGSSVIAPGSVVDANGRTYQGYREGKYFLPNDPAEQDRLDFQHAGTHLLLDKHLAWAPIESPKRVLDIATGTGIWASDFAEEHPGAEVVGSDMTPIQPPPRFANLSFVIEDAEEQPWVHDRPFDYVHARYVYTCFDNPSGVIRSAFEALNPGGWLEYQDASPVLRSAKGEAALEGNPLKKLLDLVIEGAALRGRDVLVTQHYKRWMEEAGFVDVREVKLAAPINEWHPNANLKLVGLYHSRMMIDNLRGIAWKTLEAHNFTEAQIDEVVVQAKREFRNLETQGYYDFYVVYGRKPNESEVNRSADAS